MEGWFEKKIIGGLCRMNEILEKLLCMLKIIGEVGFLRINLKLILGIFFFEWFCDYDVGFLVKEMNFNILFYFVVSKIRVIIIK